MEPIEYQGTIEQFLCEKATVNHVPINAILELTPLCNMNCDMCFVRLSAEEMKQKGRLRSAEEWIGLGRDMKEAGTLFVLFTGGEPLLHPEFKKIYVAYKRMGMILTVNTNGTLIDEQWADFFAEYPPRRINLTLYGKDEHTYQNLCHYPEGFGKALRAIQLLQERKVDVKVNGSITPENIGDIEELFSIVDQMGAVWKFDTYMYPASRERNHLFEEKSRMTPEEAAAARVKLMEKRQGKEKFPDFVQHFLQQGELEPGEYTAGEVKCRAGRSSFMVNWQGMMRPCVMLSDPEEPVFDIGFAKAWERITERFGNVRLSAECSACTMREVCQTCAACAVLETGSFDRTPEYMCRYTKETLRLLREALKKEQEANADG